MERNRNKPVDNPDERTTRSRPFLVSVVLFLYFESSKSGMALLKIDTRKHPDHFMDAFYENKIPEVLEHPETSGTFSRAGPDPRLGY